MGKRRYVLEAKVASEVVIVWRPELIPPTFMQLWLKDADETIFWGLKIHKGSGFYSKGQLWQNFIISLQGCIRERAFNKIMGFSNSSQIGSQRLWTILLPGHFLQVRLKQLFFICIQIKRQDTMGWLEDFFTSIGILWAWTCAGLSGVSFTMGGCSEVWIALKSS